MITVSISINGEPIFARTAVNQSQHPGGACDYLLDDGTTLIHDPENGAIALAKKMLDTIKEQRGLRKKPSETYATSITAITERMKREAGGSDGK